MPCPITSLTTNCKMVLWDLPEIAWKQSCEDYIKELGLLYIDCVFMLFSDKYMLSDIYCKLCVAMAIHGIPFFVICTMSENCDQKQLQKIKFDFQKKDILVRLLNPKAPGAMLEELLNDFFKEVTWNRSHKDQERTAAVSEDILGQTVRLKNLEKKPELNGRCGVCVGFDKEQKRYHIRLITKGVESDIALKDTSFSILKPKLIDSMVRVKDLESKPELNGRYGFVDAFLRENERYMVLLPDKPGQGLALALKSANLDKVDSTRGQPVRSVPQAKSAQAKSPATAPVRGGTPKAASPATGGYPAAASSSTSKPPDKPVQRASQPKTPTAAASRQDDGSVTSASMREATANRGVPTEVRKAPFEEEEDEEEPRPSLQLSLKGLLGLRVWAVVGDPDESEELIDHLMDCGKTVFIVSPASGQFKSTADLNSNPSLPNAEVLAFVDRGTDVEASVGDAVRLGLRGILLHPSVDAFGPGTAARCRGAGLAVHGADVLERVEPGAGIPVAPLD